MQRPEFQLSDLQLHNKSKDLIEASLCSFSLLVFSYFILYDFPLKLISLSGLTVAAYLLSRQWVFPVKKPVFTTTLILFIFAGLILGILLAMFYRWFLGISLLPRSLHYFVIIAALTGAVEEIVFRGFLQDQVKTINGTFSIFFSTVSHTAYKCCLFLSPAAASGIDVANLAFWTFLFGLVCGSIKHFSKSIIPTLLAHAIFDVLVYAEFVNAPWWVW
jgi:membrane protease YdiL (CAAX protease family)